MPKTDKTASDNSSSESSSKSDNLNSEKENLKSERQGNDDGMKPQPPEEFCETFTITRNSKEEMGLRLSRDDCRVSIGRDQKGTKITCVSNNSPLFGKAFVGDRIVQIDSTSINKSQEFKPVLMKSGKTMRIRIGHGTWSWCANTCITMDKIHTGKDKENTLGPIDVYCIVLHLCSAPEIMTPLIGFQVKYDSRERLVVTHVEPNSLTAVHLRPGDIIREVNGHVVTSKTMLQYYISEGIYRKQVCLLIEIASGANDQTAADTVEMATDAKSIAAKQAELLRKGQLKPLKPCMVKGAVRSKKQLVAFAAPAGYREDSIGTDCDITKLRPVASSKQ